MSDFRGYLERLKALPDIDNLSADERRYLHEHYDPHAAEVNVNGQIIDWHHLDEVEVVRAARSAGPSGSLVRFMMGDDRYHVGFYYGAHEAVLTNISLDLARYIIQTVAYYAPNPVRYKGIEGLSPIAHAS